MIGIFLADCGPSIGLGHLRRLLVLAAAFQREGVACRFLLTDMRYANFVEHCGMESAPWCGAEEGLPEADVVAIDGYTFDALLPSRWSSQTGCATLVVDDLADKPGMADVVLNHNLYGAELDYTEYRTRLLLAGPQYALVDPAFAALAERKRPNPPRIVVSFGGTDDGRYAEAAARALLDRHEGVMIDLVLPPSAVNDRQRRVAKDFPGRCHIHVGAAMVERLADATVYVGAAGVTLLEAIAAGLDVVVCAIAENQRENIRRLKTLSVPAFDRFAPDEMAAAALQLLHARKALGTPQIDGRGAERVAREVLQLRRHDVRGAAATLR